MGLENDDKEFEQLLADKRHKEMLSQLKGVVVALERKDNSEIVGAIEKQQEKLGDFLIQLKKEEKEPNIVLNQDKLVSSIENMANSITKSLEEIKSLVVKEDKPCEWEFKVKRNSFSDLIETVSVTKK